LLIGLVVDPAAGRQDGVVAGRDDPVAQRDGTDPRLKEQTRKGSARVRGPADQPRPAALRR